MGFLGKLHGSSSSASRANFYAVHVKCDRCGEIIAARINLANDLSLNDDGNSYFVRKLVMGSGRCFQQIEIELSFNASKQMIDKQAHGGVFVEVQ